MKLSHLTIAVSVALGLAACGGSSDDAVDNSAGSNSGGVQPGGNGGNTGAQPGTGNTNPPAPTDTPDTVKDPDNRKAATDVEKRFEQTVMANKAVYSNRRAEDRLAGYQLPEAGGTKMRFQPGSTATTDILRASSITNYLAAGWVNDSGNGNNIRLNPLQTYALGDDGVYYRIKAPTGKTWDAALPTDTFTAVSAAASGGDKFASQGGITNIPASALVYIPNVVTSPSTAPGADESDAQGYVPTAAELGGIVLDASVPAGDNAINPNNVTYAAAANESTNVFDTTRGQVQYESVNVNSKDYTLRGSNNSTKLDLDNLQVKEEVQNLPITLNYSVIDNKATQAGQDDDVRFLSTAAGELRVYNLNYSRALLEVNDAAAQDSNSALASARNGLGFSGQGVNGFINGFGSVSGQGINGQFGPFQVIGYQTPTLPDNGRAKYTGTSYGVNSTGNIQLEADFGLDRAGISGSVTSRTNGAGTALPDMVLHNIQLSQPGQYRRTASIGMDSSATYGILNSSVVQNGVVDLGGNQNWGTWAVKLFGPNAENAGGVIAQSVQLNAGTTGLPLTNVVEVFDSARGDINPKSLNNP